MTCGCAAETVLNMDEEVFGGRQKDPGRMHGVNTVHGNVRVFNLRRQYMCQCEQNFHYEHELTRCFSNKAIGDECANNYECYQAEDYENDPSIKSVTCNSNTCTCADNYILSENKCVSAGLSFVASLSIIILVITLTFFS
ncbi:uncharacterized protein LOC143903109 [Temnothorax americanus]|uniref:uncharacterized protein LOC143903109 n=1 Tax=Temnothorax americanus TaxID=1964332 RepID=UPI00406762DD